MFQLGQARPKLNDLILALDHLLARIFNIHAQLFQKLHPLMDLRLQDIELVPRQLSLEMLQFSSERLVTPGFSSLPLQRTNLPLHFAN